MIVFRLCKAKYANDLSGRGAEITGGRWNSKGVRMVYTSASRALCTTEIAVHTPLGNIPSGYQIISIKLPENRIQNIPEGKLPADWKSFPHSISTQRLGDEFSRQNKHLILQVPSAAVEGDFNFLVNPLHPDFLKVKIVNVQDFNFDKRLFQR